MGLLANIARKLTLSYNIIKAKRFTYLLNKKARFFNRALSFLNTYTLYLNRLGRGEHERHLFHRNKA